MKSTFAVAAAYSVRLLTPRHEVLRSIHSARLASPPPLLIGDLDVVAGRRDVKLGGIEAAAS